MSFQNWIKIKKGKKWLLLYIIFPINLFIILIIILLIEPYLPNVNLFISLNFCFYFNLVSLLIIIVLCPFIYGIIQFFRYSKRLKKTNKITPHIAHKLIPIIIILLYNFLIILLIYYMESYAKIIYQRLEFRSIPIFLAICICLIIFLYPCLKYGPEIMNRLTDKRINARAKSILLLTLITAGYFFAFAYPLLHTPASVIYGEISQKPDVIAHRGGSQLGPENTIEVAEVALDYDIVGWEVDIAISNDGKPFLMHDSDLKRTTDLEKVFPNK